jgi:hypothetical protein
MQNGTMRQIRRLTPTYDAKPVLLTAKEVSIKNSGTIPERSDAKVANACAKDRRRIH